MHDDRWQSPVPRPPASSRWLAVLVGLTAFVTAFRTGLGAARDSLDGSWTAVLSWSFSQGAQFGSDIIFTYGPLGFLIPIANYHPDTYGLFLAGQVFLSLIWALLASHAALRLGKGAQIILVLLLLAWTPLLIIDVSWYLTFAFGAVLLQQIADQPSPSRSTWILAGSTLAAVTVLGLTKFTFTLLWLAFVAYGLLQLLLARRLRAAAVLAALAAALYGGLWLASGQHPASLPRFLLRGLEISLGYGTAMAVTPPLAIDLAGLAVLGLASLCLAALLYRAERSRRVLGAFLLLVLALTWKAGYTRADSHVGIFLGAASLLAFLSTTLLPPAAPPRLQRLHWRSAAAVAALGLFVSYQVLGGFLPALRDSWHFVAVSLQQAAAPRQLRQQQQATWDNGKRDLDLPESRRLIGDAGVDLLMHEQSYVLLNDFRYVPRPLFQGYAATNAPLARRNEAKLLGKDGPRFLLYKPQVIDNHLPGNEDPLSQLAAMRAFTPRAYEKGFVVLERERSVDPMRPPTAEQWHETGFGRDIAVDAVGPQLIFYHVELSLLGRLYALLLREPELGVELTRRDGGTAYYRLVRSLGDAGSLVSPLLASSSDYLAWYTREREDAVGKLRFVARSAGMQRLFAARITYALQPVTLPRADGPLPENLRRAFYPGFSHAPHAERSPVPVQMVRNLHADMLFLHAPSAVDFVLPRGRWRAEGRFGLRADTYAPGVCPQSDGTLLRVYQGDRAPADRSQWLYARQIDPLRVIGDRGNLPFTTPVFDSDGNTPVTFEFSAGESPTASTDCDWALLGPLRFIDSGGQTP